MQHNDKQIKKEVPIALKRFIIGGWILLSIIFIFILSYKPAPLSSQEIAKIKAQKKSDFTSFEHKINSIPKQCDADYTAASKLLLNNGEKAKIKFNDAHYSCLDAFNQFQNVKIPDNLSDTQSDTLNSAMDDLTTAYASKRGAAASAYDFFETGEANKINKAKEEIELSQENLIRGMLKIKEVENELEISKK